MEITVKSEGKNSFSMTGETVETLKFARSSKTNPSNLGRDEHRTITLTGKIRSNAGDVPRDETISVSKWAMMSAAQLESYQKITASVMAAGQTITEYEFDNSFVLSYTEKFTDQSGVGTFSLVAREMKHSLPDVQFLASNSGTTVAVAAWPAFPDNSVAVFSTVSRTGQRSEDFSSVITFTGNDTVWTVINGSGATQSFEQMLNLGYRWEKVEPISRPRKVFPSIRGDVTIGSQMFYTRHLADVEIRGLNQRPTASNSGDQGNLPSVLPNHLAYLVDGACFVIEPEKFFADLGINEQDIFLGATRYVVPIGSNRIGVARARESGFMLKNVHVREVHNMLGDELGFDLRWDLQLLTAVITFRVIPPLLTGLFTPRLIKSPIGTARAGSFGLLGQPKKIIIHHTVGVEIPSRIPYHFVVDFNGTIHLGVDTTYRSGGTGQSENNDYSIQIAVLGNWDNRASGSVLPTNGSDGNMDDYQREALINLIADCLISFPSIPLTNRFNLPIEYMSHFANASRQNLNANYRRHREHGIKGHEDTLGSATRCPGVRLYNWCRDSFVSTAISRAGGYQPR